MINLKPTNGGFQRSIRTTEFILKSIMGEGPENSRKFNPIIGAPMTDIFYEYKNTLHRLFAKDAVEREEEKRIRRGKPAYTGEEYNERLNHFLSKIPHKLYKMRYSSFTRYFGHLIQLGWVKKSGYTEPSAIQDNYPQAPPRVFYKITLKGRKASAKEIADPIQALYHYSRAQRSAKRNSYYRA